MLLVFVLWGILSGESNWGRSDSDRVAVSHQVRLGLLSWAELSATRAGPGESWELSAELAPRRLGWSLLLTLPVAWLLFWRQRRRRRR